MTTSDTTDDLPARQADPLAPTPEQRSLVGRVIGFCLANRLVVVLSVALLVFWALAYAPFDWRLNALPRDPVPVDAIPDIGENQQIVYTAWPGRSPRDVDDQITYPLTTQLLAMKGVKAVRGSSMYGFSSVYVIFGESGDFWESRTRLLEKLSSLPPDLLPADVRPRLGPEATALGQVFWYTLAGRDPQGRPAGGWDLEELRTIQDWTVRQALAAAEGVAEVASIGGFVREYQVDVDPAAMRARRVTIAEVYRATRAANADVSARTIELNRVEHFVRGIGLIRKPADIANATVAVRNGVPVLVKHVATVSLGPASRRGALDVAGAEAVGGVVVAAFGANPLAVISNVKTQIRQIAPSLPAKTLPDGTVSQVTIVPFYDRTGLIHETLGTLQDALRDRILITVVVVVLMVFHLRSSLLIGLMLPLAVGMAFLGMKWFGVDANIVALSGIAIAIGTIVDMGIVICENVLRHLDESPPDLPRLQAVHRGASEVGGAVLTAVLTTVVGFLPVFAMTGPEGKLFRPLAFTKTFALVGSVLLALLVVPTGAYLLFRRRRPAARPSPARRAMPWVANILVVVAVGALLAWTWKPLGMDRALGVNLLFVAVLIGVLMVMFRLFQWGYPAILGWCLRHKVLFLSIPAALLVLALVIWWGFATVFAPVPAAAEKIGLGAEAVRSRNGWAAGTRAFPGLGGEFMPALDEGSFLYMPTTMVHASITEALDILARQDRAFMAIPEVERVVGKIGRVDSALDPAPISMIETVIAYKPEYRLDGDGKPVRQWRPGIRSPDDIWREIAEAGRILGVTGAPKLQPIATRLVMLQTGMRAPMGVKVRGGDLKTVEAVGVQIERLLRQVPGIDPDTVAADRTVAKPYLVIDPRADRVALAKTRYGLNVADILAAVQVAVGGGRATTTIEGRERFNVRVRYPREFRDDVDSLGKVLIASSTGQQVPLAELADIRVETGTQVIKSEGAFKVGYVTFDKVPGQAEVAVVERAKAHLDAARRRGDLQIPAGVRYDFAGTYENQVHAQRTLSVVVPMALAAIFVILYLQFRSVPTTLMVFSGIAVALAGGFLLIWLYGVEGFMDVEVFGRNLRDLFGMHAVNLSVAVWVGFLALFGIASDDGVVMATYLEQTFRRQAPATREAIRAATVRAGTRRVRACLMTTATTLLALLPVLTSTGRGSDIMVPMAIPSFGGMAIEVLTMLVVPVLYCAAREFRHKRRAGPAA